MNTLQLSSQSARKLRRTLLKWYQPNLRQLPWRIYWQQYQSPYHIWVSEIMLQQTTIKAVLGVYENFFQRFPTVKDLAKSGEEDVRLAVRGLGYYRRFSMLHRAAIEIVKTRKGEFPKSYDDWLSLPGVGEYTAAAVASITLGAPQAVVDGNVERVFCRLFDIRLAVNDRQMKPHYKRWAASLLDQQSPGDFNQALMELGQLICRPVDPSCPQCPFASACLAHKNNSQDVSPGPKIKTAKLKVRLNLTIYQQGQRIGILKRDEKEKFLKNSWGFRTELNASAQPKGARKIGSIRHNITNHNIHADIWLKKTPPPKHLQFRWLAQKDLEKNLVSNLDRKAMRILEKER